MFRFVCVKICRAFFPALALFLFFSCMGAASQVTIEDDGSGSILLEYRVSVQLESLGGLDGNRNQPPVPVGRADLERSAARIPGMRLVSYSARQDGNDAVHRAELAFASPQALSAFFDSSGRQFRIDFPARRLSLRFPESEFADPAFREFAGGILQGYDFSLSLTVPGTASAEWFGRDGVKVQYYPGYCIVSGRTVHYSVAMAELVFLETPLFMEINWQ